MMKRRITAIVVLAMAASMAVAGSASALNGCASEARIDSVNERAELRDSGGCPYAYIYGRYNDNIGNNFVTSPKSANPLYSTSTLRVSAPTGRNMNALKACTSTSFTCGVGEFNG